MLVTLNVPFFDRKGNFLLEEDYKILYKPLSKFKFHLDSDLNCGLDANLCIYEDLPESYKEAYEGDGNFIDYSGNKTPDIKKQKINQNSDKNIPISFEIEMTDAENITSMNNSEVTSKNS